MKPDPCKYRLYFCLSMLFLFAACSRPLLKPAAGPNDVVFSQQAWQQLVKFKSLKADAILFWEAVDGNHGKYRIRLFMESPERLKIQWLTPWGSVAGQLLIAERQFWLSDSKKHETWHGPASEIDRLLPETGEQFQIVAARFFEYWPLLFTPPEVDVENFPGDLRIDYFSVGSGADLNLNKRVILPDGGEMQVRLFAIKQLNDEQLMPEAVEIISKSGQVGIKLRRYSISSELAPETFIYKLKNFSLHEYW